MREKKGSEKEEENSVPETKGGKHFKKRLEGSSTYHKLVKEVKE